MSELEKKDQRYKKNNAKKDKLSGSFYFYGMGEDIRKMLSSNLKISIIILKFLKYL